ncbi:MAG: hypothetical protein ABEL97_04860 [Salinibacter sp.]
MDVFRLHASTLSHVQTHQRPKANRHDDPLATEIIEDAPFYRAEAYHQKHKLRRHPALLKAVQARYPDEAAFTDAPAAATDRRPRGGTE